MSLLFALDVHKRQPHPDFKKAGKASPLLFDFGEQNAQPA